MLRRCALLWVALALMGCVEHPVGPARTYSKFEGKARTTAESALSQVETVRVIAQAASRGNAFGPYTSQVLSDAEGALDGLSGTFGSIQPPNAEADLLRSQLDELLSTASDHVSEVRIAARRGELSKLADVALPIDQDIEDLRVFIAEHT